MAWILSNSLNNGYPYNTNFIGYLTDKFVSGYKYNLTLWRIDTTGKINNGYPYTYYMPFEDSGGGGGEGEEITQDNHGNVDNYSSFSDVGGSNMNVSNNDMPFNSNPYLANVAAIGLNSYALSVSDLNTFKSKLSLFAVEHPAQSVVIQQIFGANVLNCVITCKMFPLSIPTGSTGNISALGVDIVEGEYSTAGSLYKLVNFGDIDLNITNGWELSECDFQIYLPYAGLYSIPIVGNEELTLHGCIDFVKGGIDYYLKVNGAIALIASGEIGIEIPINTNQAEMLQNSIVNSVQMVASGASTLAKNYLPIAENIANSVSDVGNVLPTTPLTSAKVYSSLSSVGAPQNPYIIVRRAKINNNNNGLQQIQGLTVDKSFTNLNNCKGFAKCINYKCNNIGATEEEKTLIENLLNSGVIL